MGLTIAGSSGSSSVAQGRAKYGGVTQYAIPGLAGNDVNAWTSSAGRAQYFPFKVDKAITIDQLVVEITTAVAASTIRIAIYNADTDWQPTTLVTGTDTGAIAGTATGVLAPPISDTVLPAGRYLAWLSTSTGNHTFRTIRGNPGQFFGYPVALGANAHFTQVYATQAYGAPPSTGLAWDSASTGVYFQWPVFLRIKTP